MSKFVATNSMFTTTESCEFATNSRVARNCRLTIQSNRKPIRFRVQRREMIKGEEGRSNESKHCSAASRKGSAAEAHSTANVRFMPRTIGEARAHPDRAHAG